MNFYHLLEEALTTDDVDIKERSIRQALEYCSTGKVAVEDGFVPLLWEEPSYAECCRIVPPRELPRRRNFRSREGLALQLHAIVHIEYSAIDLAMDAVYRFPEMPIAYKRDWLEVAQDEVRHFRMLEGLLQRLGYRYGDFPVHRGLFDAALHTAGDLLDRMAVIPRHYEATGLDVNPRISAKLEPFRNDLDVKALLEALQVIYDEEVAHVRKGDRWFRSLCRERGLEPEKTFRQILENYRLNQRNGAINVEARKKAGFTCRELITMGAKECES